MDSLMASVVFFRAVNVGGHQKLQLSKLARDLAQFDVINIGAAGTFVVRKTVSETKLRNEILRRVPFRPEMMICSAREVLALSKIEALQDNSADDHPQKFVTILEKAPRIQPNLPLSQPAGEEWEVRIVGITGRFVLSLRKPGGTYSNAFVENLLHTSATTRNLNTMVAIWKALSS